MIRNGIAEDIRSEVVIGYDLKLKNLNALCSPADAGRELRFGVVILSYSGFQRLQYRQLIIGVLPLIFGSRPQWQWPVVSCLQPEWMSNRARSSEHMSRAMSKWAMTSIRRQSRHERVWDEWIRGSTILDYTRVYSHTEVEPSRRSVPWLLAYCMCSTMMMICVLQAQRSAFCILRHISVRLRINSKSRKSNIAHQLLQLKSLITLKLPVL